jgi:hypothetical protein
MPRDQIDLGPICREDDYRAREVEWPSGDHGPLNPRGGTVTKPAGEVRWGMIIAGSLLTAAAIVLLAWCLLP